MLKFTRGGIMEKITINLEVQDGKVSMSTAGPLTILDLLEVTFAVQLEGMKSFLGRVPEEDKEAIKEDLYDKYNYAASNILEMFAPEFELREDLTAEAILKAENEIIEKKYDELKNAD